MELWLIASQATSDHWRKKYISKHIGNYDSPHSYKVYFMISPCHWYAWNTKIPKVNIGSGYGLVEQMKIGSGYALLQQDVSLVEGRYMASPGSLTFIFS